jgi:hypothetical protein
VGISIPSAVLDDLDLRDNKNQNFPSNYYNKRDCKPLKINIKMINRPIDEAESERLTLFVLSDPALFISAYNVFALLDHGEVTPQTLKAASKCLMQLASSMNTDIAWSVVDAAADFANPNKAASIINRTNSFLEGFLFSEQVAKAGRLAANRLHRNTLYLIR